MAGTIELGNPKSAVSQKAVSQVAESSPWRECLAWFAREKQWINDQHLRLCRIAAPTFLEQKRAEWMVEQFRALGWESKTDRAGNVVTQPNRDRDAPFLALTAHLDTVLAPRSSDDVKFGPDGKLYGPGVSDNGAGLTALLAIAAAWKAASVAGQPPLLLIANVGEEGEGNLSGMRYLCRPNGVAARVRAFVVLDGPTTDHITCQALASRRFDMTITGPGGHSWSDYGIGNPVHVLSRAITLFSDLRGPANAGPRFSYNFGVIEGGASINSIPSQAKAKVDLRSESGESIDEMADLLSTCLERALEVENERSTGTRLTARIKEIGSRPGGRLAEDAPILQCFRAIDTYLGIRSHVDCASTDANIPLSLGIPAVSIGAGGQGGGAHTPSEWFNPEGRDLGLRRVVLALALLSRELSPLPETPKR